MCWGQGRQPGSGLAGRCNLVSKRWGGPGLGSCGWRRAGRRLPACPSFPPGCGELSDKTDCACNVHAAGGHLLCHDDVIGDRRVSYIIYLTDPDQGWGPQDGGQLELYPEGEGESVGGGLSYVIYLTGPAALTD